MQGIIGRLNKEEVNGSSESEPEEQENELAREERLRRIADLGLKGRGLSDSKDGGNRAIVTQETTRGEQKLAGGTRSTDPEL